MANNDALEILIATALDLAKSIATVRSQLNQIQASLKSYTLKVTAALDKTASRAKINEDLKSLKLSKVKVSGKLDSTETRKQLSSDLAKLKKQQVKIQGVLDRAATNKAIKAQLGQITPVKATATVKTEGGESVEKLSEQMEKAGSSAEGLASKVYMARTALQMLYRAARETINMITEIDEAATNLAIITGGQSADTYKLLNDYNALAKELGATTTQVSDAAASWLRQGMDMAETADLIEQSMMLSKVAMVDSATATKNLTSAMRGYGLAVSDVSGIVDKLAALDSKAAVTASDLAIAMSQTASSANIGGVSMDRLLGYLAAVQEATQRSAETIGQSFKTIFARMGNVKLGKFFDDEGEDLSDVESSLRHYGISLRDATGDFRDFSAVLDELAEKWEGFRATDQRAIAQAFAGTRQQENFLVLMQHYGEALEYAGIAADSAGTALKKFGAYQESIEAKAAGFTAALESLTMDTFDPDFVKDLIDTGASLVELVEKTGLLRAALVSLGAAGTMKGIQMIASGFRNTTTNILNLGTSINTLRRLGDTSELTSETIGTLGRMTKGLTDQQLALVLSSRNLSTAQMTAILTASGLTKEEAAQKLQTLGLATAEGTATGATWNLSAAMTGLGASIKAAFMANPIGMTAVAIGTLITVITTLNNAIDNATNALHTQYEEEKRELEEIQRKYEENSARLKELIELKESNDFSEQNQQELDDLEKINEKLALQIEYRRMLAEDAKKEAGESARAALYSRSWSINKDNPTTTPKEVRGSQFSFVGSSFVTQGAATTGIEESLWLVSQYLNEIEEARRVAEDTFETAKKADAQSALQAYEATIKTLDEQRQNLVGQGKELVAAVTAVEDVLDDDTLAVLNPLIEAFQKLAVSSGTANETADALHEVADAVEAIKPEFDLSALTTLQDELKALSKAYSEVLEKDSTGVSFESLKAIADKFSDVSGIETYISRLAQAGTQADVVKGILEELANEKVNNETNSRALAAADDDVVAAMLREAGASASAYDGLYQLRLAMIAAETTELNFSQQIQALREVAEEAGLTASMMQAVFSGATMLTAGTGDWDEIANMTPDQLAAYRIQTAGNTILAAARSKIKLNEIKTGGGGGGGGSKAVDEYTASIDKYREALKKLEEVQNERDKLKTDFDRSDDLKEKIALERQLIEVYGQEQQALHELNDLRDTTITEGVSSLRELGFTVQYNAETNELWIENLDHLNELAGQTTEETNALRKETENLIGTLTQLNEENQEASADWWKLKNSIEDAHTEINSLLEDIVKQASNAVDAMQNVYSTLHNAADEYAETGYITVDTLQAIISLGPQYMHYLVDENGQLVINEQSIRAVLKAKMDQLAVETAMTYVQSVAIAQAKGQVDEVNRLIYATEQYTKTTWGLVYASIEALNLSRGQKDALLHNVDAIRSLADAAGDSIGSQTKAMRDGVNDILQYTMDMLKSQSEQVVKALQEQKDAYSKIISAQKESLQLKKKETDYAKSQQQKLKEIAKLQAKIDILSLDSSRDAQAKRAQLLEELAELNEDLAESQQDHAIEEQENALDQMEKAYSDEKDKEIKKEEEKYSSTQQLHDAAIRHIEENWDTLMIELLTWNEAYGNSLNSEILESWNACIEAVKIYGSYVDALYGPGGNPEITNIIAQMKANSAAWHDADAETRKELSEKNKTLASSLSAYGLNAHMGSTANGEQSGVWYLADGSKLYDYSPASMIGTVNSYAHNPSDLERAATYVVWKAANGTNEQTMREYVKKMWPKVSGAELNQYLAALYPNTLFPKFHSGGIVGTPTAQQNEMMAALRKGEMVLTEQQQHTVNGLLSMAQMIQTRIAAPMHTPSPQIPMTGADTLLNRIGAVGGETVIQFGDVNIYGATDDAVKKHREVNREFVNEIVKVLNLRR